MYASRTGPLEEANSIMRKFTVVGAAVTALLSPAAALAKAPTRAHTKKYLREYHAVRHHFGPRVAGCNLIERRGSCHKKVSDADLVRSIGVLGRTLRPPAPVVVYHSTASSAVSVAPAIGSTAPASGLEACIIRKESGGNPSAVNGQYGGIGQWNAAAWAQDGGTRYASSPLGASYAQQEQVLRGEGASTMARQQGQYDGCS
jgi:hypothetical protein